MVLVCNNPAAAEQVLEALPVSNNLIREQRLNSMRGKPAMNRGQLMQSGQWQQISTRINEFTQHYA